MKASTMNGTTFQLYKRGSTTKVGASVSYDRSTYKATLDPTNSPQKGATYRAVMTTEARDLAGNGLDQDSILAGLQEKRWTFKIRL